MQDIINQDLQAKKYQPDPRDEFKAKLKHSSTSRMIARYCLHAAMLFRIPVSISVEVYYL